MCHNQLPTGRFTGPGGVSVQPGDGIYIYRYISLLDIPSSPLPSELQKYFELCKKIMRLRKARCHYISKENFKPWSDIVTYVGSLGCAYQKRAKNTFAVVQSDDGIEATKRVILHEMLHLKVGGHRKPDTKFEKAERNYIVIMKKLSMGKV